MLAASTHRPVGLHFLARQDIQYGHSPPTPMCRRSLSPLLVSLLPLPPLRSLAGPRSSAMVGPRCRSATATYLCLAPPLAVPLHAEGQAQLLYRGSVPSSVPGQRQRDAP